MQFFSITSGNRFECSLTHRSAGGGPRQLGLLVDVGRTIRGTYIGHFHTITVPGLDI